MQALKVVSLFGATLLQWAVISGLAIRFFAFQGINKTKTKIET